MNFNAEYDAIDSWDAMLTDIESDLSDFLDPDSLEAEVLIDEQGQFVNWLESEARLASQPLPNLDAPVMPPVNADFIGFGDKGGFGVPPVRTKSPLERLDQEFGLESSAIGASRSQAIGFDEVSPEELAALSASHEPAEETKTPKYETGFGTPAALESAKPEDDFLNIPVMDLMDAIEPRKPKDAPRLEMPSAPEAIPLVSSSVEMQIPELEPVVLEPVATKAETETSITTSQPRTTQIDSSMVLPVSTTMRRYFDATDLLEAQNKLIEVLAMPKVPLVVFLGRAAERCSNNLPNISSIALAEVREEGLVNLHLIGAHESFRKVLLEINESRAENHADLTVADLSELELDEVVLPVATPHLLLTRIAPDPEKPGRMRGTLTLTGAVGLRSGAAFLKAVVTRLESPITLML